MPLIEELDATIPSHYFSADYLASRSPGPHLKAIIDDFLQYHQLYDKRNEEFADSLDTFAALGFGWERAAIEMLRELAAGRVSTKVLLLELPPPPGAVRRIYEHVFSRALNEGWRESHPRVVVRPGEITHRGIHCTPDGVNVRLPGPEEWKLTWTSARGGLEAHPDWLMQMCGYCEAYGFDTAVLRAFYVNGWYEKGQMGKPVIRQWRLRWSEVEKEENWQVVETHRQLRVEEGWTEWGLAA